jgi:hypothetical protein
VINFKDAAEDSVVFSGDFTNATGEISHEFLALLSELGEIDPDLLYRRFKVGDGKPVTRGCFQGMPASWVVGLQIGHFIIASIIDDKHNFRIKGDDIIAYWSRAQIQMYTELCFSVGLVINKKSRISDLYGTYCEGDYILEGNSLRRLPTFSLRSFVNDTILSSETINSYLRRGVARETLITLQSTCHGMWLGLCAHMGVDPYMPKSLGGLDMIPRDMSAEVPRDYRRVVQLANNGQLPVFYEDTNFETTLATRAKHALAIPVLCYVPNFEDEDEEDEVDLRMKAYESMLGRLMSVVAFRDALLGVNTGRAEISPGRQVRNLRAFKRRCLRVPSTDTHKTTYADAYRVSKSLWITPESFLRFSKEVRNIWPNGTA